MSNNSPIRHFLKIEAGKGGKEEGLLMRVPLGLIRAGTKMRALILRKERGKINQKLKKKGIVGDIFEMSDNQIDDLIRNLGELEIKARYNKGSFRIYSE